MAINAVKKDSFPEPQVLAEYMAESAARHRHLCPRQILGIRMGLYGLRKLGLIHPLYRPRYFNDRKRLLTIVETDGCGADGVAVATGCFVGRRTLRVMDFGKMAATLVNTTTGAAVRVVPQPRVRELAINLAPQARTKWHAYLDAYQIMADEQLMAVRKVTLNQSIGEIFSRRSARAFCDWCGEEIMNGREVELDEQIACRSCAGEVYFDEF